MASLKFIHLILWSSVLALATSNDSNKISISSTQVLVQFDLVQTEDWTETVLNEFKEKIAEYATEFCNANKTVCRLSTQSVNFAPDNVLIVSDYPKEEDVNSLMLFQVTFPQSVSDESGSQKLNQIALVAIVTENRKQLQADLIAAAKEPYEASFRVSFVNYVLVLEVSDQTLNNVIIPIVCSIVVLMIIIILTLEALKLVARV